MSERCPHCRKFHSDGQLTLPISPCAPISYDESTAIYESREERIAKEIERQRCIYRIGTDETILRRAAINTLMEKGDY